MVIVVTAEMRARMRRPTPAARAPSAAAAARSAIPRVTGASRQYDLSSGRSTTGRREGASEKGPREPVRASRATAALVRLDDRSMDDRR